MPTEDPHGSPLPVERLTLDYATPTPAPDRPWWYGSLGEWLGSAVVALLALIFFCALMAGLARISRF